MSILLIFNGVIIMNELKRKTMYLLTEHKQVFNQNPAERVLMDHIKLLQSRVDTLEKSVETAKKPLPKMKVDAKVYVWDVPEVKHKRHFSHFDEYGYIYTFIDGKTSFTSRVTEVSKWVDWDYAE